MAVPPLTSDADLRHFPGAPYPRAVVRAAEKAVRGDAGWHIAPVFRETIEVKSRGGTGLVLPSLRVVTVHSVTVGGSLVSGWSVDTDGVQVLHAPPHSWWRPGTRVVVDLTHGFDDADDLLPVVAARCQRQMTDAALTQRSETVGLRTSSESYNIGRFDASGEDPALGRYSLSAVA